LKLPERAHLLLVEAVPTVKIGHVLACLIQRRSAASYRGRADNCARSRPSVRSSSPASEEDAANVVALQGAPAHAQARLQLCTYKYLGHRNIQNTVRYTVLSPARFKDFWRRLPRNGNRRGHVGNHLFILFTLIILGNQEVLMARKEPHFRSEKTSLHVDVPCSAAARAVAQLGFFSNLIGKLLAAFTLVGAAGFVAVLSEPTSSRLISFAMLGVVPALAARILGWALYQALKSTSCSCYTPNSPLPAGRCGRARTNYGRQMKTRSGIAVASLKQGRVNAVRAAFNAGFISAADRRNHAHNEGRRPS
jgi:hypothetical protein